MSFDYRELLVALLPEAALVLGAFLVIGFDLLVGKRAKSGDRFTNSVAIGAVAVVAAALHCLREATPGSLFGGLFVLDSLAFTGRLGILTLTLITLGTSLASPRRENAAEFVALLLFATAGLLLMADVQQLLLAFLGLELASLSLYLLVGFDRDRRESAEAALKYFLTGGIATAFLLFGFSLIYGITGSIFLPHIASQLAMQSLSPLLLVALVMVVVSFGFKVAAVPFHLWAPDAYEGAPPTAAALVASASKLGGFIFFIRLLWLGFGADAGEIGAAPHAAGWTVALGVVSVLSLVVGNLAALAQHDLRRLVAYSAVAHAGALLLGVIAAGGSGPAPVVYYAVTYGLATAGIFGVFGAVLPPGKRGEFSSLAGLRQRSPILAACLAVFVLSLAGIPPLAGFVAKFAVFSTAFQAGGLFTPIGAVAGLAIVFSAVALYYYLLMLKPVFVLQVANPPPLKVAPIALLTLLVTAALLVALGLWPSVLLSLLH